MRTIPKALTAVPVAAALFLAACGDDGGGAAPTTTTAAGGGGEGVSLADVCPETIVIQTDWNPEAEHGALYEMVGENPSIDTDKKAVTGPLVAGGEDTGVKVEIRVGGPAIGFQQVVAQMYQDRDILLGYVSTDEAIENFAEFPTRAIVAPLEINPQIIMWDPETYPDVETIRDLGEENVTIRYFGGGAYMQFLLNDGQVSEAQLDGSYDGTPAVFVAEGGKIAQQGFASAEPYIYKNEVTQWGKEVAFQLIHEAGWTAYAAPLAVRAADFEANTPCFEQLVPIVQQAQVDYINDPAATNALILELVEEYNTGWVYSEGVAEFSVQQQKDLGLVGNGPDSTLGNFDEARLTDFISKALPVFEAKNPPADLSPDDLVTNEFIDESIGL
jgi:hypothetical protein